jgi:hypothetical protein
MIAINTKNTKITMTTKKTNIYFGDSSTVLNDARRQKAIKKMLSVLGVWKA